MPIFDTIKIIGQLVPLIYSIGTTVRRGVREIDQDDSAIEVAYVILDAVEEVVRDIRDALPARPALTAGRGQNAPGSGVK